MGPDSAERNRRLRHELLPPTTCRLRGWRRHDHVALTPLRRFLYIFHLVCSLFMRPSLLYTSSLFLPLVHAPYSFFDVEWRPFCAPRAHASSLQGAFFPRSPRVARSPTTFLAHIWSDQLSAERNNEGKNVSYFCSLVGHSSQRNADSGECRRAEAGTVILRAFLPFFPGKLHKTGCFDTFCGPCGAWGGRAIFGPFLGAPLRSF